MKNALPVICATACLLASLGSSPRLDAAPVHIVDPQSPRVREIAVGPTGNYWLAVAHRSGVIGIDHYSADGGLRLREFVPDPTDTSVPALLPQADGTLLGGGFFCDIWRFHADGRLAFRTSSRYLESNNPCYEFAQSPSKAVWYAEGQLADPKILRRRDAAGRDLGPVFSDPFMAVTSNLLSVPGRESVWAGTYTVVADEYLPSVAEIRPDGSRGREWLLPVDAQAHPVRALVPRADGGLAAFGSGHGAGIWLGELDAIGTARWRLLDPGLRLDVFRGPPAAASGRIGLCVLGAPGHARSFVFLDEQHQLSGRFDFPENLSCVASAAMCGLQPGSNGTWQALLIDHEFPLRRLHLLTLSSAGTLLSERMPDIGANADEIDALPAGGWLVRSGGALHRIMSDGSGEALAIPATLPAQEPLLLGEYRQDGERYAGFSVEQGFVFARIDELGQVLWQRRFDANPSLDELPWTSQDVQIAGTQVCVFDLRPALPRPPLRCLDRTTGELRFEHPFPIAIGNGAWGTLANGTLAYVDFEAGDTLVLRRRNLVDNSPLPSLALPALNPANLRVRSDRLTRESMAVIGTRVDQAGAAVAWLDQHGQAVRVWPLSSAPAEFFVVRDRLFLLQARFRNQFFSALDLQVVDLATGSAVLNAALANGFSSQSWTQRITLDGDRVFLAVSGLAVSDPLDPAHVPDADVRLFAVPLSGTRIDWQRDLPLTSESLLDLAHVRSRNALLVAASGHGRLRLSLFDAATGTPVEHRSQPCGGGLCTARPHGLAQPADEYRWLENVYSTSTGRQLQTFSADLRTAANLPSGQPGIGGAWYSPASSGQGFVLTWLPGSNTLFAPWFTYSGALGADDELRWYSLQGVTRGDDAEVTLQILRNGGGRFAQPPITTAEVVGSVSLRFSDCEHASLSYRFNPGVEGGRNGVMPWQRIGPRVHPCRDAAGSTRPPDLTVADSHGFSRRQSGAWFDAPTSGQGLMLEVVPGSNSQPGLLFAAWFTYDPTSPNDPAAQDWLVLQGTLAQASAGRVELPILRSVGGSLDGFATQNLFQIGTAIFNFQGCDRARVDYAFDNGELAAAHAGRTGVIQLERIGGCGE